MAWDARDWKKLMAVYELETERRVARYEGLTTPADRLRSRVMDLRYQFLPHYFSHAPEWRVRLRAMEGPRTLPDFACVGPIKSGTSDLATYMFQHPSILPPLAKEVTSRNPDDWLPYYPTVKEKERVAREHGKALSGHFNPALASVPFLETFHRVRPDAKVILMLRNPTDRAYSHYKWQLLSGGKGLLRNPYYATFTACIDRALELFPGVAMPGETRFPLLETGIYANAVDLWTKRFGPENVYVLRAEDFFADVASTLTAVHAFLGLPPRRPEVHPIVNQNPIKAPPFEKETRVKLQAFYRPYNEKLYDLLGRDMKWDGPSKAMKPVVIWFTGLSGAGKTTLARRVHEELVKRRWSTELLDGDAIRNLFPSTGFARADRHAHVCRVGYLASRLEAHGVFAIASLISPYAESRAFVRDLCKNFVEIHLSTPLAECEKRDVKGLYAKVRRGEIKGFTGIDDPYEAPTSADLVIDTAQTSVEDATALVMRLVASRAGGA